MKQDTPWTIAPETDCQNIVNGPGYRISVLTPCLIRLEYQKDGRFEDRPTQIAIDRSFPPVNFTVADGDKLRIKTEKVELCYDKGPFSWDGLTIKPLDTDQIWHYRDKGWNLYGTARTLDGTDGPTPLEDGVLSRSGFAVVDDSRSMVLTEDGWVARPISDHTDIYFFGYGRDFYACLRDFYKLTGPIPLLPRFALGNWWCRYYAYTQEQYRTLMTRFGEEKLPFSVAVIDMDWHYVNLDPKYGYGWTGYTWNEELFPDHKELLRWLHEQGLRVSLNLHPADGVRGHEKAYPAMAAALGMDPVKEEPIPFDVTDQAFMEAYFKYLHHPLEEEGVDFWWIDWQQGTRTRWEGLDPLWMLNHFHYLDNGREGKRALLFSRYAGVGSHRYPIGFSGDTAITWECLDFQPWFTATASNIGYAWWSHDIGGHNRGCRDDELTTRWVQLGVFSPIFRLHSTNWEFAGREPWNYDAAERRVMEDCLRLRHALIPYIYTWNARTHMDGIPLVQPVYYRYPWRKEAYEGQCGYTSSLRQSDVSHPFFFGDLLVAPITRPMNQTTRRSDVALWLPEGAWTDLFTGIRYKGGCKLKLYRPLESIPVLAKAGTVIPMQKMETVSNDTGNPADLELLIVLGGDGEFELYEDDGVSFAYWEGHSVRTAYTLRWGEKKSFTICPAEGDKTLIPKKRCYRLKLYGVGEDCVESASVEVMGCSYDSRRNILTLELPPISVEETVIVTFRRDVVLRENNIYDSIYRLIHDARIDFDTKERLFQEVCRQKDNRAAIATLTAMPIDESLRGALLECLLAE